MSSNEHILDELLAADVAWEESLQKREQPCSDEEALLGTPEIMQVASKANRRDAIRRLRFLTDTAWLALVSIPVLLALILWRVW